MQKAEHALSKAQIRQFIRDGFVRLDCAFPSTLADEARAILWRDIDADPNDPESWTQAVVRLGDYDQSAFHQAVNMPVLYTAFDQLVGKDRWLPRKSLGTFPVRFPGKDEPGDAGWHVEASFPGEDPHDYLSWRVNINSRGRALLMLFLFSDVGDHDAPTRIRVGSHRDVASILQPYGVEGLAFMELAERLEMTAERSQVLATGKAGTVYLCHPFLVHAAQGHHGTEPRFMAQPPLFPAEDLQLRREGIDYSPVERSIRLGIGLETIQDWM